MDNDIFITEIPLTDHVPGKENFGTLSGTLNGGLIKNIRETLNVSQAKVYDFIENNPGCMGKDLTVTLGMPRDTFNKVIRFLFEKKIVERRGSKKIGGYWMKKETTSTDS